MKISVAPNVPDHPGSDNIPFPEPEPESRSRNIVNPHVNQDINKDMESVKEHIGNNKNDKIVQPDGDVAHFRKKKFISRNDRLKLLAEQKGLNHNPEENDLIADVPVVAKLDY